MVGSLSFATTWFLFSPLKLYYSHHKYRYYHWICRHHHHLRYQTNIESNSQFLAGSPPSPTQRLKLQNQHNTFLISVSQCDCKEEKMNAFKAFKACVPIAWSPNLYITLVRGIPGTRRLHRRTLEALRLRKCNRTVMRWNTPTVRGMLQQVKRLVAIETEEMFKARKQKEATHRALCPPLVVSHHPVQAPYSS